MNAGVENKEEATRLPVLQDFGITDTGCEVCNGSLYELVKTFFNVGTVFLCLIREDRPYFKTGGGFDGAETPRDLSVCREAVKSDQVLIVEDASIDPRFAGASVGEDTPALRFYAGAPLVVSPGVRAGAIVLAGQDQRAFSLAEARHLERFAAIVTTNLRLREAGDAQAHELAIQRERQARLQAQSQTLAEANRLLGLAEEIMQAGHWRLSLPERRRSWSAGIYRIFDMDPDQPPPTFEGGFENFYAEDRKRVLSALEDCIANRSSFALAARILRPNGALRHIEIRGQCDIAEDGTPAALFGVIVDLTDSKRTQSRLLESEMQLERLVSGAKDYALYLLDSTGHIVNWNKGAQEIKGYRAAEIIGRHFSIFYQDEDRAANLPAQTLAMAAATGHYEAEGWRLRRDGSRFWAHIVLDAIRDSQNNVTGFAKVTRDVSDLKKAESDASASRARYRLLADNATDMIVQLDLTGNRVFVSPAALELSGYTPGEMLELRPQDTIHPADIERFETMIAGLMQGTTDQDSIINRFRRKDGTYIWVEARWRAIRGEAGQKTGFIAAVRDISATQKAEEDLRHSEARYRTLAEGLPQAVWVMTGPDRVMTYANKTFYDYGGPTGPDVAERTSRVHPSDAPRLKNAWKKAVEDKQPFELEVRLRRHDGVYRWQKFVITPLHRSNQSVDWIGTSLDIDDIVVNARKLEETSELLTLSQQAAGAGIFDVDLRTGQAVLFGESIAMHGLHGNESVELSIDEWLECLHPGDSPLTLARLQEACDSGTTYCAEFRVIRGGAIRWIHGTGRAYYDPEGHAYRMVGLNFDITARKVAESLLISARAEAEAASAAKTDFLASMSHEIRTPLNSILGYADLLLDQNNQAPDDRRKLTLIQQSGSALLTIVNDILDFSKIEAGHIDLHPTPFQIDSLVDNVVSMLSGAAASKGLWFRQIVAPDVPSIVVGDQDRLRQILINLLNNAIKFTHTGGVTLHVENKGGSAKEAHLRFTVRDTGIGISPAQMPLLFQKFSQGDNSITRRFGGTGLGLAISKQLVNLMGGAIGVDSREGQGAAFWLTLALPVADLTKTAQVFDPQAPAGRPHRSAYVLLVEDVEINQGLARAVLESGGHRVDVASSGLEAIHKVQTNPYDIVLMDIQMPGMDGITATKHIRAMDSIARGIPIIAMTANVLPQQVSAFKAAGMDDHVGKPFKRDQLFSAIDRLLSAPRAAPPAPQNPPALDGPVMEELIAIVGAPAFDRLVRQFRNDIRDRFGSPSVPPERHRLQADVHAMTSAAGLLGFTGLSRLCHEAEIACIEGQDIAPFVQRLDRTRQDVLREIMGLLAETSPQSQAM